MGHLATISSKGQLVIPAELRKKYKLKAGSRVTVEDKGGAIRVTPDPFAALFALRGKFAQYPLEDDLKEDRRKWEEHLETL